MKVRHAGQREEKAELMMTPMIDIVFQLLIFFIMTFKIVTVEGDFNIKMPLGAPSEGTPEPDDVPPIKIRLTAGGGGQLAGIRMGDTTAENFQVLREKIRSFVGDDPGPGTLDKTEVELDCDYALRYEHVVEAITAVSGWVDDDGHVHKMVEKIKFSQPRGGG